MMNLDPLQDPTRPGEWRFGAPVPGSWGPSFPAVGWQHPDPDGNTVWIERRAWRRADLPGLIAFLTAVHAGSDPAGLHAWPGAEAR